MCVNFSNAEKVNVLRTSSPEAGECFQIVPEVHIALQASVGALRGNTYCIPHER